MTVHAMSRGNGNGNGNGKSSSSKGAAIRTAPLAAKRQEPNPAYNSSSNGYGGKDWFSRVSTEARVLSGGDWGRFLATLAVAGAVAGTLLDGIHSKDGLQIYDTLPLVIGGLKTSWAVPPLLAAFYVVLGSLAPLADAAVGGDGDEATLQVRERSADPAWIAASAGALAAELQLSAYAYATGMPFSAIFVMLGAVTVANWAVFDRTRQGIALAALCALGAPAAEIVLLQLVPLWHYPRADILGGAFVSWVPWCYAFYTPFLTNLARHLWSRTHSGLA